MDRHWNSRFAALPSMAATGISGAQTLNSRSQFVTSGFGQTSNTLRTSPLYSSKRIVLIACIVFPNPISSAKMPAVSREQKRDAIQLIGKRIKRESSAGRCRPTDPMGLQQVVQSVVQFDHVVGRLDATVVFRRAVDWLFLFFHARFLAAILRWR